MCSFDIAGTLSDEIPTVGVVEWATDLESITEARIEFALDDPEEGELNVGSGGPISVSEPRALLLGLKPDRSYTYRIVARSGDTECVSPNQQLTTETDPDAPSVTRIQGEAAAGSSGFVVTCIYSSESAVIVDTDGDVVWSADAPLQCSRAHMDWDGNYMWILKANPSFEAAGQVQRVRMDGTGAEPIAGLERSHHDFAVLPGGGAAFLVWTDDRNQSSDLVERSPDGTLETIARLDDSMFLAQQQTRYHANALRYLHDGDSYTVSDLSVSTIAKIGREGQVQFQVGQGCSNGSPLACASAPLLGNHGHHLLANGNLLVFLAGNGSGRPVSDPAPVYEYSISENAGALSATLAWEHVEEARSLILGDVQRLPNGNTLITYSTDGEIHEVSPAGDIVQRLSITGQFGYASFRQSLYGPPQ